MEEPNEVVLGAHGWVEYVKNPRDVLLCRYFWPATTPAARAVILVIHGHGAHVCFDYLKLQGRGEEQTYSDSFIERANSQGFSICAIDFQGHGRSDAIRKGRFYIERFQHYVDDVLHLASSIARSTQIAKFSNLPMMVLGASLGGCIGLNSIHQQEEELFQGAILLAPMLSLEKVSKAGLNPYLRPIASVISALAPTAPLVQLKRNTKFPELQELYDHDPYTLHGMTAARLGAEYLLATERTVKEMPKMNFPFLIFHSRDDDMTDFEGSKKLMELSSSPDKHLEEVNDRWHILLKEPGFENIESKAFDWIKERTRNGVKS